ncbi:MAG TPA: AI-2E family transporter [Clostridia bacterium]|nr:AI-2E family transporter [Clostridia bacterium]
MKIVNKEFVVKLVLISVAAFAIFNLGTIIGLFNSFIDIFQPIFIGIVFALILNVPLELLETKVFKGIKKQKVRFYLSVFCSIILLVGCIVLFIVLIIPAGIEGVQSVITQVNSGTGFDQLADGNALLNFLLTQGKKLYGNLIVKISDYVPKLMTIAQSVLKVLGNIVMGLFIAIMMVINRDNLKKQFSKLLHFLIKRPKLASLIIVSNIALKKFSKYLAGQLTEAILLGTVCYIIMSILNLPYAALISMIIGFVNLIPIVGAYIGGAFSAVIILAVSPVKALIFIIFIIILQQLESFTTYPIIVGKYVGLNSFWIIVSIVVWGGIFGFWGMFLGVPLTAFLQEVISLYIKDKNRIKLLASDGSELY